MNVSEDTFRRRRANHLTIPAAHPDEILEADVVVAATILKIVRSMAGALFNRCDNLSECFLCVSRASYIFSHEGVGEVCFQKVPIWIGDRHVAARVNDLRSVDVEWRCKEVEIGFQVDLVREEKERQLRWEKRLIYIDRPRVSESLHSSITECGSEM